MLAGWLHAGKACPMDYSTAARVIVSPRWQRALGSAPLSRRYLHEDMEWLLTQSRRTDVDVPRDFHEAWYAHVEEMRKRADLAEHALIRDLRNRGVAWSQISDAAGGELGTRQAVQQRWERLRRRVASLA